MYSQAKTAQRRFLLCLVHTRGQRVQGSKQTFYVSASRRPPVWRTDPVRRESIS